MIRVGIVGYGNLGRGTLEAVTLESDMEVVGIFTRRDPKTVKPSVEVPVYSIDKVLDFKELIDVVICCGGSKSDLREQTPLLAKNFNVVDSFDTHHDIPLHFDCVDKEAKASGHTGIISVGWDPGMFSLNRLYMESILPNGSTYTFWGEGVSQGHSDAVRRIKGVLDCRQYTVPVKKAMEMVEAGLNPVLTTREKHTRVCYVVAEMGADLGTIEKEIKEMPNYFSDYDTTVHFISKEEMEEKHSGIPHGGFVYRSGVTGIHQDTKHLIKYQLKLDSNPAFTGSILTSYARACYKINQEGDIGCKTVFDIAPKYLSKKNPFEQRKESL